MDETVNKFADACREAASSIHNSKDLWQFIEAMRKLVKGDDVTEQIMSVVLAQTCWHGLAKIDDVTDEVVDSLDASS